MGRIIRHVFRILRIVHTIPGYRAIIALQFVSGITSFLGIPLLIPFLKYMKDRSFGQSTGQVQKWVDSFFAFFNVTLTPNLLLITISFLVVGGLALNAFSSMLIDYIHHNRYSRCSKEIFRSYLDVRWQWLVRHHSGEISHALYNEIAEWSSAAFYALRIMTSLIQFVTFFFLASYISLTSTIVVGTVFMVLMVVNVVNAQIIRRYSLEKNEFQKGYSAFVNSTQENKKFLKASLIHDSIISRFDKIIDRVTNYGKRIAYRQQLQSFWIQATVFIVLVIVIAFHEQIRLGFEELVVLLLVFMRLMPQLSILTADYLAFSRSLPVYDSVEKQLADLSDGKEVYGKYPYEDGSSINFEDVCFSYDSGKEVLDKISLNIPSRSTVAIVGGSGEGKTTILDLILGLWTPSSGRVNYGGLTHEDIDYSTLRKRTAYVSQETTLFNGSLRENLTIGSASVSEQELEKICRMVSMDELVNNLPKGLDTEIGENGIQLSGGQRQRVALGRAMLVKPDILILDEATSSLDVESEQIVREAVNSLHQDLTIIIVAHRLSTVRDTDLIYVMENGRICESGSFEQLMQRKGRFSSLYSSQLADNPSREKTISQREV